MTADLPALRALAFRANECHGIVTVDGEQEPCNKPATAIIDGRSTEDETYWPACAYHAHRWGRGRVVPLADLRTALLDEVEALRAAYDDLEAVRLETMDQRDEARAAVGRVEALADDWVSFVGQVYADDLRAAIEGTAP
jgi:hypothetical protein